MIKELAAVTVLVAAIISVVATYMNMEERLSDLESRTPLDAPPGAVLPYVGQQGLDAVPPGWTVCGNGSTPNLNRRVLFGTNTPDLVGESFGELNQFAGSIYVSSHEYDGAYLHPPGPGEEGADNGAGDNWNHKHLVIVPSVRTMFFCKL